MKYNLNKKKIISFCIVLIGLCVLYADSKNLDNDLDYLINLYEQCYIKYDEDEKNGFNIKDAVQEIKSNYEKECRTNKNDIDSDLLAKCMNQSLIQKNTEIDGHFYIKTKSVEYKYDTNYWNYVFAFFEKRDNEFYVKYSFTKGIKKHQKYTGDKRNLFKCIYANQELYLPGLLSNKWEKEISISLDNTYHNYKAFGNQHMNNPEMSFGVRYTDKSLYLSFGDCYLSGDDKQKNKIVNDRIQKQVDTIINNDFENIIIDLRGNRGGYVTSYEQILKALAAKTDYVQQQKLERKRKAMLNGKKLLKSPMVEVKRENEAKKYPGLFSNVIEQKKSENKIVNIYNPDFSFEPSFDGNILILVDLCTGSAAEMFITELQMFKNVTILGTNTYGSLDYGGRFVYELPNSRILLYLSCESNKEMKFLQNNIKWHGDGNGFYPDYWTTSFMLKSTIFYLTRDKKLNKILKNIDKGLLL